VRLVFLGTPPDAVPTLRALVGDGHDVGLVVTQPDRRRGRGAGTAPSPVKEAAIELGLPVRTPERAREVVEELRETGAELGVVVAFGQLLPEPFLDTLSHGFVNLHFSLLPRWRGAAPVERAILAGDRTTGVAVMEIERGLDTGPVYAMETVPIGADETAGELRSRLIDRGTRLMVETVPRVPVTDPIPQAGEPTYAEKLTVDEFRLDWSRPPEELARVVRAGNPRPGAWTTVDGKRLKVWRARVAEHGALVPLEVQPEGRGPMAWDDWRRGHGDAVLGS
jgi:methionyl-tRNA formyltransferase